MGADPRDDLALGAADCPATPACHLHQGHSGRKNTAMAGLDPVFDLTGRVAVITGAGSGIGRRFAHVLAGRGMHVVLGGRRADRLEELVAALGDGLADAVPGDVTDEEIVRRLVGRAVGRFGRLDVMVNNAGTSDDGPAESQTRQEFDRVVALNLAATFIGSREAARVMLPAGKGSIINIASIAGLGSLSDRYPMAAYVASKTGVVGLTRELGAQWAARGVRVNAIAPGWFPTEMTGDLQDQEQVRWIERRTPGGRPGRLEELDGPLIFLASDASTFVVGQTIAVDGGWTLW